VFCIYDFSNEQNNDTEVSSLLTSVCRQEATAAEECQISRRDDPASALKLTSAVVYSHRLLTDRESYGIVSDLSGWTQRNLSRATD